MRVQALRPVLPGERFRADGKSLRPGRSPQFLRCARALPSLQTKSRGHCAPDFLRHLIRLCVAIDQNASPRFADGESLKMPPQPLMKAAIEFLEPSFGMMARTDPV